MDSRSPSDLVAIAANPLALPAVLNKTEGAKGCVHLENISTVFQHDSLHTMPGSPPSDAAETSENSDVPSPLHVLPSADSRQDRFIEQLLTSFSIISVPSPPTPDIFKTRPVHSVANTSSAHPIVHKALLASINSESLLTSLSSLPPRAPNMSPIPDIATTPSTDDDSNPHDYEMSTTAPPSQQSTTKSQSPTVSSEALQVQLLQGKVEEATTTERDLQHKVREIWRRKEEHNTVSAGLSKDIDAIKIEIKGLQAEKKNLEIKLRYRKDRQSEITDEKKLIDAKAQARWKEGNAIKRDVDEAARTRRSLEKQLKEAEVQEELISLYPDTGLRKFAQGCLKKGDHSKHFNSFSRGQATDEDLAAIENLLEEAEDGTQNDVKIETELLQHGGRGTIQVEPLVKTEAVKMKTELGTPGPNLHQGESSSPTAQGLLEIVRRMRSDKKNLQTHLNTMASLKRKLQSDDADTDANGPPKGRAENRIKYQLDTESDIDIDSDSESGSGADE